MGPSYDVPSTAPTRRQLSVLIVEDEAVVARDLQRSLSDMGYDVGTADGKVGPKTRAALRKFQADMGLSQTGRLDHHTLAALNADHSSPTSGSR